MAWLSQTWKVLLTLALLLSIGCSVTLAPPRRRVHRARLRRLVLAAVGLYVLGAFASVSHHALLAGIVYASGILVCSLAVWLSRGIWHEDGPDDSSGDDDGPDGGGWPPGGGPDGLGSFDWNEFERELQTYTGRAPTPV